MVDKKKKKKQWFAKLRESYYKTLDRRSVALRAFDKLFQDNAQQNAAADTTGVPEPAIGHHSSRLINEKKRQLRLKGVWLNPVGRSYFNAADEIYIKVLEEIRQLLKKDKSEGTNAALTNDIQALCRALFTANNPDNLGDLSTHDVCTGVSGNATALDRNVHELIAEAQKAQQAQLTSTTVSLKNLVDYYCDRIAFRSEDASGVTPAKKSISLFNRFFKRTWTGHYYGGGRAIPKALIELVDTFAVLDDQACLKDLQEQLADVTDKTGATDAKQTTENFLSTAANYFMLRQQQWYDGLKDFVGERIDGLYRYYIGNTTTFTSDESGATVKQAFHYYCLAMCNGDAGEQQRTLEELKGALNGIELFSPAVNNSAGQGLPFGKLSKDLVLISKQVRAYRAEVDKQTKNLKVKINRAANELGVPSLLIGAKKLQKEKVKCLVEPKLEQLEKGYLTDAITDQLTEFLAKKPKAGQQPALQARLNKQISKVRSAFKYFYFSMLNGNSKDQEDAVKALKKVVNDKIFKRDDVKVLNGDNPLFHQLATRLERDELSVFLKMFGKHVEDEARALKDWSKPNDALGKVNTLLVGQDNPADAEQEKKQRKEKLECLWACQYEVLTEDMRKARQANAIYTDSKKQQDRARRGWLRGLSSVSSTIMGFGEGAVAAVGIGGLMFGLIGFPGALGIGLAVFFAGWFINKSLVLEDSYDTLKTLFLWKKITDKKGERLVWGLWLDEQGREIPAYKKGMVGFLGVTSLASGFVYGALSAHSMFSEVLVPFISHHLFAGLAMTAVGGTLAAIPVTFTAIGLSAIFFVVLSDLVKNNRFKGIWHYIKETYGCPIRNMTWPQIGAHVLDSVFCFARLMIGLSINTLITVASFGVFHQQGILLLRLLSGANSKSAFSMTGYVLAGVSGLNTTIFGIRKVFDLFANYTLRRALADLITLPVKLIDLGLQIAASLFRAPTVLLMRACLGGTGNIVGNILRAPVTFLAKVSLGWNKNSDALLLEARQTSLIQSRIALPAAVGLFRAVLPSSWSKGIRGFFKKGATFSPLNEESSETLDKLDALDKEAKQETTNKKYHNPFAALHADTRAAERGAIAGTAGLNSLGQMAIFGAGGSGPKFLAKTMHFLRPNIFSNVSAAKAAATPAEGIYSASGNMAGGAHMVWVREQMLPSRKIADFGIFGREFRSKFTEKETRPYRKAGLDADGPQEIVEPITNVGVRHGAIAATAA